jgi:hypothetical protein
LQGTIGVSTPRTRIERALDPDPIRRLKATSEHDLTVGGLISRRR